MTHDFLQRRIYETVLDSKELGFQNDITTFGPGDRNVYGQTYSNIQSLSSEKVGLLTSGEFGD